MVQALTVGTALPIPLGEGFAAERLGASAPDSALFDLALLAPKLVSAETGGDGTASLPVDAPASAGALLTGAGSEPVEIPTGGTPALDDAQRFSEPGTVAVALLPPSNPADDAALSQALAALAALEQAGRSPLSPKPAAAVLAAPSLMTGFGFGLAMPQPTAQMLADASGAKDLRLQEKSPPQDKAEKIGPTPTDEAIIYLNQDGACDATQDGAHNASHFEASPAASTALQTLLEGTEQGPVANKAEDQAEGQVENKDEGQTPDQLLTRRAVPQILDVAPPQPDQPSDQSLALPRIETLAENADPINLKAALLNGSMTSALPFNALSVNALSVNALSVKPQRFEEHSDDAPSPYNSALDQIILPHTPDELPLSQQAESLAFLAQTAPNKIAVNVVIDDARRGEQTITIGDLVREPNPIILPNRPMPIAPPVPLKDPTPLIHDHAVIEVLGTDAAAALNKSDPETVKTMFDVSEKRVAIDSKSDGLLNEIVFAANPQKDAQAADQSAHPLFITIKSDASSSQNDHTKSDDFESDIATTNADDQKLISANAALSQDDKISQDAAVLMMMSPHVMTKSRDTAQSISREGASDLIEEAAPNQNVSRQNFSFQKPPRQKSSLRNPTRETSETESGLGAAAQILTTTFAPLPKSVNNKATAQGGSSLPDEGSLQGDAASSRDVMMQKAEQLFKPRDHQERLDAHQAPQIVEFDLNALMQRINKNDASKETKIESASPDALNAAAMPETKKQTQTPAPLKQNAEGEAHTPQPDRTHASPATIHTLNASEVKAKVDFEARADFEAVARASRQAEVHDASRRDEAMSADAKLASLSDQIAIESVVVRDVTAQSTASTHGIETTREYTGQAPTSTQTPQLAVFTASSLHDAAPTAQPPATTQMIEATQPSYTRLDNPVFEMQRDRALETQVIAALKAGSNDVRVSLYPPQLGQVTINLALDGQKVKVSLKTSNREATSVLSDERTNLAFALHSEGFTLEDFDVADESSGRDKNKNHQEPDARVAPQSTASSEFSIDITI